MFHQFHGFRQISHTHRAITPHPHPYPPTIWLRKIVFFFFFAIISDHRHKWLGFWKKIHIMLKMGSRGQALLLCPSYFFCFIFRLFWSNIWRHRCRNWKKHWRKFSGLDWIYTVTFSSLVKLCQLKAHCIDVFKRK